MNIYWLESFDHCEDWFVAASDVEQAVEYFADYLGYDIFEDEVSGQWVLSNENLPQGYFPRFADNEDIIKAGGQFIDFHDADILAHVPKETADMLGGETRIVRFGKQVFMEGNVLRVALEMKGLLTQS